MKKVQLVIDIGSKFTTISQLQKGLIMKDASLVYVSNKHNKMELIEIGRAVANYINKKTIDELAIYPIVEGTVCHDRPAILMYKCFIDRIIGRSIFRPKVSVLACISCGLNNTEKSDIERVLIAAGASEVILLESSIAGYAASGISDGSAALMLDVGASKSEIAVVNKDGIVSGCSLNIGGNTFNQAIMDYLLDFKKCRMPVEKIEKIKKQLLNLGDNEMMSINETLKEIGTDNIVKIQITSGEIKRAVSPFIDKIISSVFTVLNQLPDAIANDVAVNGIILSGGSTRINGFKEYIENQVGLNCTRQDNPENLTSLGGLYYLEHRDKLANVLNVVNFK